MNTFLGGSPHSLIGQRRARDTYINTLGLKCKTYDETGQIEYTTSSQRCWNDLFDLNRQYYLRFFLLKKAVPRPVFQTYRQTTLKFIRLENSDYLTCGAYIG